MGEFEDDFEYSFYKSVHLGSKTVVIVSVVNPVCCIMLLIIIISFERILFSIFFCIWQ